MTKDINSRLQKLIGVRLTATEQDALFSAANREDRSMSALARMIIKKWLVDREFLNSEEKQ